MKREKRSIGKAGNKFLLVKILQIRSVQNNRVKITITGGTVGRGESKKPHKQKNAQTKKCTNKKKNINIHK